MLPIFGYWIQLFILKLYFSIITGSHEPVTAWLLDDQSNTSTANLRTADQKPSTARLCSSLHSRIRRLCSRVVMEPAQIGLVTWETRPQVVAAADPMKLDIAGLSPRKVLALLGWWFDTSETCVWVSQTLHSTWVQHSCYCLVSSVYYILICYSGFSW